MCERVIAAAYDVRPHHTAQALGRGGYGMVYAAQKSDTGKLYAVKCMGACLVHGMRCIAPAATSPGPPTQQTSA